MEVEKQLSFVQYYSPKKENPMNLNLDLNYNILNIYLYWDNSETEKITILLLHCRIIKWILPMYVSKLIPTR